MTNYEIKRTVELTPGERGELRDLFAQVFGHVRTDEEFLRHFGCCAPESAWHVMVRDDNGKLCAGNAFIPYRYRWNGTPVQLALSVDSMVLPHSGAGPFCLMDMHEKCKPLLLDAGVRMMIGFPNDNSFDYYVKFMGYRHVGDLSFYMLPLRFNWLTPKLAVLNPLLGGLRWGVNLWCCFTSEKCFDFALEKVDDDVFRKQRYNPDKHHRLAFRGGELFYSLYQEERLKAAYILDILPLSPRNFYSAFQAVARQVRGQADAVVYAGMLPTGFSPLRISPALMPRQLHMVVNPLAGAPEIEQPLKKWNINLSNFDVR